MNADQRINLLVKLGDYLAENNAEWKKTKELAAYSNAWFTPQFIDLATENIYTAFLQREKLEKWINAYQIDKVTPKTVGIIMAGNIPMVGFHDLLCVFASGHNSIVKTSSKDDILVKHLVQKMYEWEPQTGNVISFAERLAGCEAFIGTGSNNTGRYFEYYFGKYPNIIRKNRTSVAILDGNESDEQLNLLADDIQLYFGLGCRNVTKIYVPEGYNFESLLSILKKYDYYLDNHKYKHNYDYHLALLIMNSKSYMNNGSIILAENLSFFSPISQVHYESYKDKTELGSILENDNNIQCIVGSGFIKFGQAQSPSLTDYADGIDTMKFLSGL